MEALGINPWILLAQIVNFVILVMILRVVAYGPIKKMLSERRERIEQQMQDAEFAAQAKAEAETQRDEILAEARREAREIIAEGNVRLENIKKASVEEARQQADEIIAAAHQEAEKERNRILGKMRGQITSLAIAAAQKIIAEKLDEERQHALVDSFFSGVREGKIEVLTAEMTPTEVVPVTATSAVPLTEEAKEAIRQNLTERMDKDFDLSFQVDPNILGGLEVQIADYAELVPANVTVTSAIPLTEEEEKAIRRDLNTRLGEDFKLSFQVDPYILGGLVVQIGDRVMDGSVAGQLGKLQDSLA